MRICVNALPLSGLVTGVSRYVRNLYTALGLLPNNELLYYTGAGADSDMPQPAETEAWIKRTDRIWSLPDFVVTGLRSLHWLRFEAHLRSTLSQRPVDLYHETTFTAANIHRNVPQVFTLYDLSLLRCRDMHPRERIWFADLFFKRRLPEASHIITISSFIRDEAIEVLGIPEDRITAIPLAPAPQFQVQPKDACARVRETYGLPEQYFLFVGTLEPRKNLETVAAALRNCAGDYHIVLTGWKGWGAKEWLEQAKAEGYADRLHLTGYIPEKDLPALYAGAQALVYVSHYEGFGLPVVEAMACGCPVICSNVASLPEAGGDAACYVAPNDLEGLIAAMDRVATDETVRSDMRGRGLAHAASLTWEHTARETLRVFEQVAEQGKRA